MLVLQNYDDRIYHFFKIPIKRQETPTNIQAILPHDSLSARPIRPMEVVRISTAYPTKARSELIASALSTWASLNMNNAAAISMPPESMRSVAILNTNLSNRETSLN